MTNREYRILRDSLIPQAVKHADRECGIDRRRPGPGISRTAWPNVWNRTFLKKMDDLVREAMKK